MNNTLGINMELCYFCFFLNVFLFVESSKEHKIEIRF